MSLRKLYAKATKAPRAGHSTAPSKPKATEVTQENYSFDYLTNFRDVEKFSLCKRFLANDVGTKFGECSNIIEYGEHYVFHPPDRPDEDGYFEAEDAAMTRAEYQIEYSVYIKTKSQYESRCAQVYLLKYLRICVFV